MKILAVHFSSCVSALALCFYCSPFYIKKVRREVISWESGILSLSVNYTLDTIFPYVFLLCPPLIRPCLLKSVVVHRLQTMLFFLFSFLSRHCRLFMKMCNCVDPLDAFSPLVSRIFPALFSALHP